MTSTILWSLLAAVVVLGVGVGFSRFVAAARAGKEAPASAEPHSPDEAKALNDSVYEVALTCRIDGHAYGPYDTGWRCATCGNHVPRREGELYGPAEDGRHERRRRAR
jgi:hypothetical protein